MASLATSDPRAAVWEARFRVPIIVAAHAVLPLLALGIVALLLAGATVLYILTGESPRERETRTIACVVAGMLATYGVNHLRSRRAA